MLAVVVVEKDVFFLPDKGSTCTSKALLCLFVYQSGVSCFFYPREELPIYI